MSLSLHVLGLNYLSAPLAWRERLATSAGDDPTTLKRCADLPNVDEVSVLSTCGRTEWLIVGDVTMTTVTDWLADLHHLNPQELRQRLYHHQGLHAIQHCVRVASGLDSALRGESAVLGQWKKATAQANLANTSGDVLKRLMPAVTHAAKDLQHRYRLHRGSAQPGQGVQRVMQQHGLHPADVQMLWVGAGELIQQVAHHVHSCGVQHAWVCNRSLEKAQQLAESLQCNALPMNDLPSALHDADVVVCGTANPLPILGKGMVERALSARNGRPLCLLDLAVPRDIEPEVQELPGVHLYNIDDLHHQLGTCPSGGQVAWDAAEDAAAHHAHSIMGHVAIDTAGDLITHMRTHLASLCDDILDDGLEALKRGAAPAEVLETSLRRYTQKILHQPTVCMRHAAAENDTTTLALAQKLLIADTPDGGKAPQPARCPMKHVVPTDEVTA